MGKIVREKHVNKRKNIENQVKIICSSPKLEGEKFKS